MAQDSEKTATGTTYDPAYDPAGEVVDICRDLIRIDTSNYGDESGPGERKAAEHVAALLDEVGIASRAVRAGLRAHVVVAQWGGTPGGEGALLLHGHLDVVPAAADDWQVDPFSGEIQDGYLWGRGAVDMKDFDAMLLSVVRARTRAGAVPERPMVLCFTADEEAGGHHGAQVLVERPHRAARALHRGRRRGRRLQHDGPRPAALPDRGRREGHGLDAAHRTRSSRPRLDDQRRQRGDRADRRGGADRRARVAGAAHARHADAAGRRRRARRHRGDAGERRGAGRGVRRRGADDRRGHPQHRQPDDARRRLQGERDPRPRRPPTSTAGSCPATRTSSSTPSPSCAARASRSTTSRTSSRGRRRTTGTWSTR